MFHHGIAGSQVLYNGGLPSQKNLITEQARQILNDNELGTLKYYLDEYCKGYINISAFVLALFDLLDTPAKAGFWLSLIPLLWVLIQPLRSPVDSQIYIRNHCVIIECKNESHIEQKFIYSWL